MALRYLLGHTTVNNARLVLKPKNGFWALLNRNALSWIPTCSSSSTTVLLHGSPFGGTCIYRGAHNDDWIIRLARFAVEQHNNKESEHLRYVRVVGASHTMVSSMLYHITLEAVDVNKPRMYYAVVWLQMIKNFMELLVWKPVNDRFSVLGVKCGDLKLHEAVMFYMNHIQRDRFPH